MKPKTARTKGEYCAIYCEHLIQWHHPFWQHTCWCNYQLKDLLWYDGGWIADCLLHEPDAACMRVVGRLPQLSKENKEK
jgi:hypothetical protein